MEKTLKFKAQDGEEFELTFEQIGETIFNRRVYQKKGDMFCEQLENAGQVWWQSIITGHRFKVEILANKSDNKLASIYISERVLVATINKTL